MSICYEMREEFKTANVTKEDKEFNELVFSRMNEIFKNEETTILKVVFNGVDYKEKWKEIEKNASEESLIELEFDYVYTWRADTQWDEKFSHVDLLFCVSEELEKASDEFLKTHQYLMYNYADCNADEAGIIVTFKNENGCVQRGVTEYKIIDQETVSGDWYSPLAILNIEKDEIAKEKVELLKISFEKMKNYFEIEDTDEKIEYTIFGDAFKKGTSFTDAMTELLEINSLCFPELETLSLNFVSYDEIVMLRVIFDIKNKTIEYGKTKI